MKRQLSYQFDLDIERVHLLINMKCDVQVWWKSGKGKIATKNSIKLTGTQKYFDVKQKLSIIAKIVMQNGILREKKTQLLIILFTSQNTSKLGGRVNLNLAEFISPENLTVPIVKKFQRSLQNCPDQFSKIVFNLSCKYIEESFGGSSENPHDISFQANNFTNSFSTSSNYGRSTVDMTFRPQKQQFNVRKQLSNPGSSSGNIQSTRSEYPSREKKRIQNERDWQKQKLETPSWQKSQRQRQQDYNVGNASNVGNNRNRDFEKPAQPPIQSQNQPRVLQFSFNPTQADRLKLGIDNSQIVKDLKQIVQQKTRTIKSLQQQLFKLRSEYQQKNQKSSSKSLNLLNQLNTTSSMKEQLQRQRSQLIKQMQFLRDQNKKLEQKTKSIHLQYSQKNNENNGKIQHMKKMIQELNNKLEDADRKIIKYKDQLFKKENQLISKQKQFQSTQMNKQSVNREQTEKLKNISVSLKELQNNFEKVFAEKEDLKRKYEQSVQRLTKNQQSRMQTNQIVQKYQQQLQKERETTKLIEAKYQQRQSLIHVIQNEFKIFSNEKINELRQKDQKFNAACKKIDEKSAAEQSMKNMISQKNIRIKTLEGICNQLQKTLEQKQTLIIKAKEYVSTKQQQIELKNTQISKRDEFIQKCRTYMQTKQKQYNDVITGTKGNNSETMSIKKQLKQKQNMLEQYIYERHQSEKQIQDMQRLIDRLKQRIMQCEDTMDQLQRKNQSQEQTLKTLVKKNLDMEIQLNMREYQIQSLRAIK